MKILLLALAIPFFVTAQTEPLTFQRIIEVSGQDSKELHSAAQRWLVQWFNNAREAKQLDQPDQILVTGLVDYEPKAFGGSARVRGYLAFTLRLEFKDERLRATFTDWIHEPYDGESYGLLTTADTTPEKISLTTKNFRKKTWQEMKGVAEAYAELLFLALESHLKKAAAAKDNW